MYSLHKGDCEHCGHEFRYQLTSAVFGRFFYAYCDACGTLATVQPGTVAGAGAPPADKTTYEIPALWEPLLKCCPCGGHFRAGCAPRCIHCNSVLSPQSAATYIQRNFADNRRGWKWPGTWSAEFCMAIEDPRNPGHLRQLDDPVLALVP